MPPHLCASVKTHEEASPSQTVATTGLSRWVGRARKMLPGLENMVLKAHVAFGEEEQWGSWIRMGRVSRFVDKVHLSQQVCSWRQGTDVIKTIYT